MTPSLALLFALLKPGIQYTLRVDARDVSGWTVEIRLRTTADTFRLAMAAHPEYDDRYWRYVRDFTVQAAGGPARVTRPDSAVWQVVAPRGDVTVRYRIELPPPAPLPRAAWQPFLTRTGGLLGGPHAFMYLLGAENMPALVTLMLPPDWEVATGLNQAVRTPTARVRQGVWALFAPNADALIDSPILAGRLRSWRFTAGGVPHRIVYWPLPDATPFDTIAFVSGIKKIVDQAIALFGRAPYREYTFQFQDGAYGALEHANSVSLGAPSADLAKDLTDAFGETAHEFVHTWNLMAIRPIEYRRVDYRTQPPVSSLWFSEGLTMFYADALRRRAGLPVDDSTRSAHLERVIARYLDNPAYARFSAEAVSRVAYNASPDALGDYNASTHLQGEVIGTMLDFVIRDATRGTRSMDNVMRLLFAQSGHSPGVDGAAIERAVESICGCDVTPFFDAHVRGAQVIDVARYLQLGGLAMRVDSGPAVWNGERERDLRIWGWEPPGESGVRIIISTPASIWGRAGLHSGDRLARIDGAPVVTWPELRARLLRLRLADTVRVEVTRPSGPFEARVVVTGFQRTTVKIAPLTR